MEAGLLANRAILHLPQEVTVAPSMAPSHRTDNSLDSSTANNTVSSTASSTSSTSSSRIMERKLDLGGIPATAAVRLATARVHHTTLLEATANKVRSTVSTFSINLGADNATQQLVTAVLQATAVHLPALTEGLETTTTTNTINMAALPHTRTNMEAAQVPVPAPDIIPRRQDSIQVAMEARQDHTHRSQAGNTKSNKSCAEMGG